MKEKIIAFFKKYWLYILIAVAAIILGYYFGWKIGVAALAAALTGGSSVEVIKKNQEARKKQGMTAEELLEASKKKKSGTRTYLILILTMIMMFSSTIKAAPGTVPMDDYLKVVNLVEELKDEIADLENRLSMAQQAAELYKQNWENAEADLDIALKDIEALEQDKLTLVTQIAKLQSKKFGVQALMLYDGTVKIALAGSYSNFLAGVSYDVANEKWGVSLGIKADF